MKSKYAMGWLMLLVVLIMAAVPAMAANMRPLGVEGAALMGATHVLRLDYTDLSASTATNTALVITNLCNIAAKDSVELVGMVLEKAFDVGTTNYTGSVLLEVGDNSDADLFLASTELASDGTEVWFKPGREDVQTIATTMTLQKCAVTNAAGAEVQVVTNATASSTATAGIACKKVYTASNYLKLTLTPNAEEALSANTTGGFRLYFRVIAGGK